MPTNEQRRATAKRKLERQLERRAKQARTRRILVIAGGVIASLAVIAAVVATVVITNNDHKRNTATATSSTTASSSPESSTPGAPTPTAGPMPAFQPSANVGANCQYPASQDKPAKPVKPPRTGKVPTDPAQVSVSMATNQGNIGLMLANNESPCTVNSFASLVGQGYFNNTKCHRLTTSPDLAVLQCGDPKGDGTGGPGYQFANEYPTDQYPANDPKLKQPVVYPRGTLAMANAGTEHQRQPVLPGVQGLAVTARLHRVRQDPGRRASDLGQDREGRGRRWRRRRPAGHRSHHQVDAAGLT